jgi:membrane protein YdbS with pleckstrin-like domain
VKQNVERASRWIYQGIWGVLVKWFRVPDEPPKLPVLHAGRMESFRPSEGFLRYLKLQFWVAVAAFELVVIVGWLIILAVSPVAGTLLFLPALAVAVLPNIVGYIAIHLRYDTTWYLMTDRSLRIRRGIWTIHETTITFENVQNVVVNQGPIQRFFGIADVQVDTAGGGGHSAGAQHGQGTTAAHRGLIEGVDNAKDIRDLILARLRRSRSAGLGDEAPEPARRPVGAWSAEQLAILREIRDAARSLST